MSQRALLLAVRDVLRSTFSFTNSQCQVGFDGQPPPFYAGDYYIAVHPGAWTGTGQEVEGLDEYYGVDVTITMRVSKVPRDRMGINALVLEDGDNLYHQAERIRAKLHKDQGSYPVLTAANVYIGAGENGFVEPLVFSSASRPEMKGPDWFFAEGSGSQAVMGLVITLSFEGARRVQVIAEQS